MHAAATTRIPHPCEAVSRAARHPATPRSSHTRCATSAAHLPATRPPSRRTFLARDRTSVFNSHFCFRHSSARTGGSTHHRLAACRRRRQVRVSAQPGVCSIMLLSVRSCASFFLLLLRVCAAAVPRHRAHHCRIDSGVQMVTDNLASDPAIMANLTGTLPDLDCAALVGPPSLPFPCTSLLPRRLHFVWVGKKSLPAKYCENLISFVKCLGAEGYGISLWTDADTAALPDCLPFSIIIRNATAFAEKESDPILSAAMAANSNPGYKADLLRYAIVAAVGGVYSDIDSTCLRSPALAWQSSFVTWSGEPWNNFSNAIFGFNRASPLAMFVLRCALAHAPYTNYTDIPSVSGPTFFTTAVKQATHSHGANPATEGKRAEASIVDADHHSLRLIPQSLFLAGLPVNNVAPFTVQTNDYNWRVK